MGIDLSSYFGTITLAELIVSHGDMLEGGAELDGKPPVGYENDTDHGTTRRAHAGAPHERASIMTIPRPSARPFPAIVAARHAPPST